MDTVFDVWAMLTGGKTYKEMPTIPRTTIENLPDDIMEKVAHSLNTPYLRPHHDEL